MQHLVESMERHERLELDPEVKARALTASSGVRHEGRIVAAQEAQPSPEFPRNGHQPSSDPPAASIGVNHWDERLTVHLMPLVSRKDQPAQDHAADEVDATDGGPAVMPPVTVAPRKPTFLQRERWKVVQKARRKGMSLRAIEQELWIHRSTVRNYLNAGGPPKRRSRTTPFSSTSDTIET